MAKKSTSLRHKLTFKITPLKRAWLGFLILVACLMSIGLFNNPNSAETKSAGMWVEIDADKQLLAAPLVAENKKTPSAPNVDLPPKEEVLPNNIDNLPVWQKYATHVGADLDESHPRIALLINGLGVQEDLTKEVIDRIPAGISLGFLPYVSNLQTLIHQARSKKHEVLLSIPMEPLSYPRNDPGPYAMLTKAGEKNIERLNWILSRATGYVGVANFMGSLFTTSDEDMVLIITELKKRGLLFLDTRESINSVAADLALQEGVPTASSMVFLDETLAKVDIEQRLTELEAESKRVGFTVAVTHATPLMVDLIADWSETLKAKGIALVPISSVVRTSALPNLQKKDGASKEEASEEDDRSLAEDPDTSQDEEKSDTAH